MTRRDTKMIVEPFGKISKDRYVSNIYHSEPITLKFPVDATTVISLHADNMTELKSCGASFRKFASIDMSYKDELEKHMFEFYTRVKQYETSSNRIVSIASPNDIWKHITTNSMVIKIQDNSVYIQIELDCDWDAEHGMQIVYRDGDQLVRVGENDGNCVADEYYRDEGVVDRI